MAKLIDYKENTGIVNMAIDAELLDSAINNNEKEPIIRFYAWKPKCVSLGRNQKPDNIDIEYCKQNNIDIVQRITGGRGLLHDNEVTYSFICPVEFLKTGNERNLEFSKYSIEKIKNCMGTNYIQALVILHNIETNPTYAPMIFNPDMVE